VTPNGCRQGARAYARKLSSAIAIENPSTHHEGHLGQVIGPVRYGGKEAILTHYRAPASVVICVEEYQRIKHAGEDADREYHLPAGIPRSSARDSSILNAASPAPAGLPRAEVTVRIVFDPVAAARTGHDGQPEQQLLTGLGGTSVTLSGQSSASRAESG
jgi:hypothetical protein